MGGSATGGQTKSLAIVFHAVSLIKRVKGIHFLLLRSSSLSFAPTEFFGFTLISDVMSTGCCASWVCAGPSKTYDG